MIVLLLTQNNALQRVMFALQWARGDKNLINRGVQIMPWGKKIRKINKNPDYLALQSNILIVGSFSQTGFPDIAQ